MWLQEDYEVDWGLKSIYSCYDFYRICYDIDLDPLIGFVVSKLFG
jgi:hypothetical protein